jgi:glyceraldehyde 3-phosphate dehydrogenase
MITIAINGFGRIGKTFLRTLLANPASFAQIKVAVINVGKADPQAAAYAFKYDSIMGTLPFAIDYRDNKLYITIWLLLLSLNLILQKHPGMIMLSIG